MLLLVTLRGHLATAYFVSVRHTDSKFRTQQYGSDYSVYTSLDKDVSTVRRNKTAIVQKRCHYTRARNFSKCQPTFKIISPSDSAVNLIYNKVGCQLSRIFKNVLYFVSMSRVPARVTRDAYCHAFLCTQIFKLRH